MPGATSRSYGIQVAQIAGLPREVIERAREILDNLEGEELDEVGRPRLARSQDNDDEETRLQLNLFGLQDQRLQKWIRKLDISSMTPLEALLELNKMKTYLDEQKK